MKRIVLGISFSYLFFLIASCDGGAPTEPPYEPPAPPVVLSIAPSDGTSLLQTGWPLTPVQFTATLEGSTATINWTVGGTFVGSGPSITVELPVGSHSVCAEVGTKRVCNNLTILRNELQIEVFLASGDKPELPVEEVTVCRFVDRERDLCQDVSSDGKVFFSGPFLNEPYFPFVIESPTTMPFFLNLKKEDYSKTIKAILIEKNWTLTKGTHAGASVPISLELAYTPANPGNSSFFIGGDNSEGVFIYFNLMFFKETFPVPVVLDRDSSDYHFTETDSINIWTSIRSLENFLGENLFYPEKWRSGFTSYDGIIITVKNWFTLGSAAGGGTGDNFFLNGYTGGRIMYSGNAVAMDSLAFDPSRRVMIHELGHVLGFGHTCSWKSILSSRCEDLDRHAQIWTPEDVAYKEVYYTVGEMRRKYPGSYGIAESHQGVRVVLLGLQPQLYQVFP